jgi:hypothetical protein
MKHDWVRLSNEPEPVAIRVAADDRGNRCRVDQGVIELISLRNQSISLHVEANHQNSELIK